MLSNLVIKKNNNLIWFTFFYILYNRLLLFFYQIQIYISNGNKTLMFLHLKRIQNKCKRSFSCIKTIYSIVMQRCVAHRGRNIFNSCLSIFNKTLIYFLRIRFTDHHRPSIIDYYDYNKRIIHISFIINYQYKCCVQNLS